MKESVLISLAFIATVIGAGFASGAEVVSYFLVYGKISFFGIILAGILFSVFSYFVMSGCFYNNTYDFLEFTGKIMPPFWQKFTKASVFISMVVCLGAMSAAAGEILNSCFFMNKVTGTAVFSVFCAILLCFSISCITKFNGFLGGIIGLGIIFSCWYILNYRFEETFNSFLNVSLSAVSYAAYNGMGAAVILCSMSRFLKTKKQIAVTALLNGLGITVILVALWCVIGIYYGKIPLGEIPMLKIASRQGNLFFITYAMILFLSVLTTAISNGFGVVEFIGNTRFGKWGVLITLIVMLFLSKIGFYTIVNVVYRLCGYISLVFPMFIVKNFIKVRKMEKKKDNKS